MLVSRQSPKSACDLHQEAKHQPAHASDREPQNASLNQLSFSQVKDSLPAMSLAAGMRIMSEHVSQAEAPRGRAPDPWPRGFLTWCEKEFKDKPYRKRDKDLFRGKKGAISQTKYWSSSQREREGKPPLPVTKGFISF